MSVLFSLNFAYGKFRKNKTLSKISKFTVNDLISEQTAEAELNKEVGVSKLS